MTLLTVQSHDSETFQVLSFIDSDHDPLSDQRLGTLAVVHTVPKVLTSMSVADHNKVAAE